jgi:cytochrome b involved in lipid metabolism
MNKNILVVIVVVILVAGGGYWLMKNNQSSSSAYPSQNANQVGVPSDTSPVSASPNQPVSGPTSSEPSTQSYTMAQVASHNNQQSCWTAISGSVYDLTTWISEHPGGERAILSICGIDGTEAFMGQHGGQGRPERELASFKIGVLK